MVGRFIRFRLKRFWLGDVERRRDLRMGCG